MRKLKINGNLEVTGNFLGGGVRDLINTIYPVGISLEFKENVDPNNLWTWQTWVEWGQGCVIIGAGTYTNGTTSKTYSLGAAGGSKDAVVVNHTHKCQTYTQFNEWNDTRAVADRTIVHLEQNGHQINWGDTNARQHTTQVWDGDTINPDNGTSGTDKNMPPYIVGKRWTRTA